MIPTTNIWNNHFKESRQFLSELGYHSIKEEDYNEEE